LVSIGFSDDNSTLLDSMSIALHQEGGVLIDATIEQSQLESDWTDYVLVEILDSTKFIFIATEQVIKVDTDTIYTFTPNTGQLIVDHYYRNEFNMLSLLSGNFSQIQVGEIQKRIRDIIVNFTIPQIESRGKIWINSQTYHPIRIVLEDDLENYTTITINTVEPLSYQNQYNDYYSDGWEIIDLRE